MKTKLTIAFAAAVLLAGAAPAFAAPPAAPVGATVSIDGSPASAQGRPLYVYDKDTPGNSACVGLCLASWPAVMADAAARPSGDWSLIDRADGGRQWAYKGKPVYAFFRDAPGAPASGDNKVPGWSLLK